MTDPVTNALAVQLEFGEDELKAQINDHLSEVARSVADKVTRDVAALLVREMVEGYLFRNGAEMVQDVVQRELKIIMDMQIREALERFTQNDNYIQRQRNMISYIAREAAHQVNKDVLSAFIGRQI